MFSSQWTAHKKALPSCASSIVAVSGKSAVVAKRAQKALTKRLWVRTHKSTLKPRYFVFGDHWGLGNTSVAPRWICGV